MTKPVDPNLNSVDPNPVIMPFSVSCGSRSFTASLLIDWDGPFSHCAFRMRARIVL